MRRRGRPEPQCLILALEFLVIGDDPGFDARLRWLSDKIEPMFGATLRGAEAAKSSENHCFFHGNHMLCAAPIQRGGGTILFKWLLDIVHVHWMAVRSDILLRGVITLGNAAQRASGMVGSGIREAERLCAEMTDVPRVIVDPRLLRAVEDNEDLRSEQHTVPEELMWLQGLLHMDDDGLWFIDYLRAIEDEVTDPGEYATHLIDHLILIMNKWEKIAEWNRIARNLSWLAQYHNRVVDSKKKKEQSVSLEGPFSYAFPSPPTRATLPWATRRVK